ncbi:MAG: bifunctional riboflavin kinase/FAD synthetase [Thiohalomonadaceae bacterium]|jgi:riboflavin kinase/FMN adenylyltransferase
MMELIRGLHNLSSRHQGCVATIGNFDGVHLGHQAVLGQLAEKADEFCAPTTVIIFEPQPQEYFAADVVVPRLTRLREKLLALRRFSVDRVLCLPFNQSFAELSAEQFIERILLDGLAVRYLVVGDDFRFGAGRRGDFAMLQAAGERHGFQVARMHTFALGGERVSSTRIRQALAQGEMKQAEQLLGRPYRMCGRVAHGDKRGRTIGFPTANIHLHRKASPLSGVFAIELFGIDGEPWHGVANVGCRPTVEGLRPLLEAHLFDFTGDLYGRHVCVNFLHKIREEQRFACFDDLKQQILLDAQSAREFFNGND